jgi:hypothetical protein
MPLPPVAFQELFSGQRKAARLLITSEQRGLRVPTRVLSSKACLVTCAGKRGASHLSHTANFSFKLLIANGLGGDPFKFGMPNVSLDAHVIDM